MITENQKRWRELCAKAAVETNPVKLRQLIEDLYDLYSKFDAEHSTTPPQKSTLDRFDLKRGVRKVISSGLFLISISADGGVVLAQQSWSGPLLAATHSNCRRS